MNPLIKLKTIAQPLLIAVSFACFGLSPRAQAVTTDPEGYSRTIPPPWAIRPS